MAHDPMIVTLRKPGIQDAHDPSHVVSLRPKAAAPSHARDMDAASQDETVARSHFESVPEPMPTHEQVRSPVIRPRTKRRVPRFLAAIGLSLMATLAVGVALSGAGRPHSPALSSVAAVATQESNNALITHVGTLILLPQGEEPTVATVSDLAALKGQAFFEHAALGDKVLMYPKAQEAVLYDPAQDKVIQFAPLTVTPPVQ